MGWLGLRMEILSLIKDEKPQEFAELKTEDRGLPFLKTEWNDGCFYLIISPLDNL
jgi:hypothetical protein